MVKPITPPNRIAIDYKPENEPPTTRLELLERVNRLNINSVSKGSHEKFWTVTVLYNTVIIFRQQEGVVEAEIYETISGVLE